MVRVAIIGATGYTGSESIEFLLRHPQAQITYLTASSDTAVHVADHFPQLAGRLDLDIEPLNLEKLAEVADVALCCLPHKVSMSVIPGILEAGVKVVDFSADYRIKDLGAYEKHYQPHTDPENLKHAVYGLPELFRDEIKPAKLVANPGCYPTSVALGLAPLLKNNLIETQNIIVSSVSGASGAGKKLSAPMHFCAMNENYRPYATGTHRHMPEMEQTASAVAGSDVSLLFQPHIGSFDRGILSSIYCRPTGDISAEATLELFRDFYKDEYFVHVINGEPAVKNVACTNHCHIYATIAKGTVIVFSAIDNLVKGAAGQAIQNMNIIFGLDETMGLK